MLSLHFFIALCANHIPTYIMTPLFNRIVRYIVAVLFIFSGFVKLVDPYGTAYKIGDYLETVNLILPLWLTLAMSLLQSVGEFVLGANALFKVCYRGTTKWLLGIMVFFTGVTLYIAIADPVQDCGCFGDALVISNWATFFKNVVLLALTVSLFRSRDFLRSRIVELNQRVMTVFFVVFALFVAITSIRHLPFLDFRPYAVGTYIPEAMVVPEGMPTDEYATTFVYEKDGVQQEFTQDNYPWKDTTWTYVDSETTLIKKGYQPPIHDFAFVNDERGDFTDQVLSNHNYTFLLVTPEVEKASTAHQADIEDLVHYCEANDYDFMLLTASVGDALAEYLASFSVDLPVVNMDDITLKTMVRAYPGLVIIKDGIVLEKYSHHDFPQFSESESPLSAILTKNQKRKNQIIVLLLALVLAGAGIKLSMNKDYTK